MSRQMPLIRARMRDAAADVMLEAAERIMSKAGFAGATMQDIAAAAGCAVGTLYLHFKNKDELLRGLLLKHGKPLAEEMNALAESPAEPLEKLRHFVTSHLRWAHDHPTVTDIVGSALPLRYYDFKASLNRLLPEEHGRMQRVELTFIQEAQTAGSIRSDISAALLTELVDGFMFTIMDQFSARRQALGLQQQIDVAWGFMIGGLLGPPPSGGGTRTGKPLPKKKQA